MEIIKIKIQFFEIYSVTVGFFLFEKKPRKKVSYSIIYIEKIKKYDQLTVLFCRYFVRFWRRSLENKWRLNGSKQHCKQTVVQTVTIFLLQTLRTSPVRTRRVSHPVRARACVGVRARPTDGHRGEVA